MKIKSNLLLFNLIMLLSLGSCTAYKKLPYLKNVEQIPQESLLTTAGVHEAKIMPNDIINISVNSTVPGASADFNMPAIPLTLNNTSGTGGGGSNSLQDYLVDKNGYINFPVLGEIKVNNFTTKELEEQIAAFIYPKYINKKPVVNVRFKNYKISVLGEVASPGIYESENGQMTILDALAAAGDMTIYGKRDNVLLIRTQDNGEVVVHRINMQDKNLILNKDLYYLQQNDKLYVEQNKARGNSSRFGTAESFTITVVSLLLSITSIVIGFTR